jgi:hypothetical protein
MTDTPRVRASQPAQPTSRPVAAGLRAERPIAQSSAAPVRDDIQELEISLEIDKLDLDSILEREGEDNFRIAEAYELAISRRDAAKQATAEAEAVADMAIRRSAEATQQRITESLIMSMKVLDPSVKAARQLESELALRAGRLRALKDSFERRSRAIGVLADLYASGYFSGATRARARDNVQQGAADAARAELARARREAGLG